MMMTRRLAWLRWPLVPRYRGACEAVLTTVASCRRLSSSNVQNTIGKRVRQENLARRRSTALQSMVELLEPANRI